MPPSARSFTRSRMPFTTSAWCDSESARSSGSPACSIDDELAAPVPPSNPLTSMTSAPALATPTTMVPISVTAGSLHRDTFAAGLVCFKL